MRPVPIPEAEAAGAGQAVSSDVDPDIERLVREKGGTVVSQAFGVLSSQLGKAIADAGFTNAIQFCSVHGITLTTSVGTTNKVVLRRVTHRPRNPMNRADTNELAIIRRLEQKQSDGIPPGPLVSSRGPDVITYYAPIVLNLPLCLNCHGEPGTDIQPEVVAAINEIYPADEATGFASGELRGLWRVDFKRAELEPATEE